MPKNTKLIITLILIGFVVLFVVQNATVVNIRFLIWKLSMSRAIFMFIVLAIGIVAGWLARGYFSHRKG